MGCPDDNELTWKTGWTYHDTEDDNPANQRSTVSHMAGNFSQHGIQQMFCIKDSAAGGSEFWPEGKYCIYKKGENHIAISLYRENTYRTDTAVHIFAVVKKATITRCPPFVQPAPALLRRTIHELAFTVN